jgi:hypothetical protein
MPSPCTVALLGDLAASPGPGEPAEPWPLSRTTGRSVRPCSTAFATATAATVLGRCVAGPGRVARVVDPDDSAEVARGTGTACRYAGLFVVHPGPRQGGAARLQVEVLMALGKHWDRAAERGDATGAQLVAAWLRAEAARELTVLRAHQVHGAALRWLLGLAAAEGLLLRLVSPEPLGELPCDDPEVVVAPEVLACEPRGRGGYDGEASCGGGHSGRCEDLNRPAPLPSTGPPRLTLATARRLRRLHDIEAAALATATVLLGRFDPRSVAVARPRVSADATSVATSDGTELAVPDYARGLLRAWRGRDLLPAEWADDVAATYLTLRLELAERRTGLQLIDPALPPSPPLPWHRRFDPGADLLAWLTGSRGYERESGPRRNRRLVGLPSPPEEPY